MQQAPPDPITQRSLARVGTVLRGKWQLDRLVGVGGMASVYAATHRNGMRGAVKLLHTEFANDAQGRSRFLREGYVANKVDHPGAVKVLDDDTAEDGSVFLVMELLEGTSLEAARLAQPSGRFDPQEVVRIGVALLEVLEAAHDKGIIHRDLKPDNLFLTRTGDVKVLDFGIARLREGADNSHLTRTGTSMGTPAFMPPEQALGNWDQVDARTDVWAVGATLFNLLTNRTVHEANTINKLLLAAMTAHVAPIRKTRQDVPEWLAAVIDRALAFEPSARWQTAMEFRLALQAGPNASAAFEAQLPVPQMPEARASTHLSSPEIATQVLQPQDSDHASTKVSEPQILDQASTQVTELRESALLTSPRPPAQDPQPNASQPSVPVASPQPSMPAVPAPFVSVTTGAQTESPVSSDRGPLTPQRRDSLSTRTWIVIAAGGLCAIGIAVTAVLLSRPTPTSAAVQPSGVIVPAYSPSAASVASSVSPDPTPSAALPTLSLPLPPSASAPPTAALDAGKKLDKRIPIKGAGTTPPASKTGDPLGKY